MKLCGFSSETLYVITMPAPKPHSCAMRQPASRTDTMPDGECRDVVPRCRRNGVEAANRPKEDLMENHTDEVARAYAILTALKENVPKDRDYVDEDYVHEYHKALDHLGQLGFDVKEFEIPRQWMKPVTRLVPEGNDYNPATYGLMMASPINSPGP